MANHWRSPINSWMTEVISKLLTFTVMFRSGISKDFNQGRSNTSMDCTCISRVIIAPTLSLFVLNKIVSFILEVWSSNGVRGWGSQKFREWKALTSLVNAFLSPAPFSGPVCSSALKSLTKYLHCCKPSFFNSGALKGKEVRPGG